MAHRRIGGRPKRRKSGIVSVLPEPWVFDKDFRPKAVPAVNLWRVESATRRKVTIKHLKSKAKLDLSSEHVHSSTADGLLLLAVQIVLYHGIVELLPLPFGYWAT